MKPHVKHLIPTLAPAMVLALLAACGGAPTKPASSTGSKPATSASASGKAPSAAAPAAAASPAAPVAGEGDADTRLKDALKLLGDRKFADAKQAFESIAKAYPSLSGAPTNLGIIAMQTKHKDEALQDFQQAVSLNPSNAVAYNWLGVLYREKGEYAKAEEAYQKSIAARSDYANPHLNLGLLYGDYMHRPADAAKELQQYQSLSNSDDLKLKVWIKQFDAAANPSASKAGA